MTAAGDYCNRYGHVWRVIGTFPDDSVPGVTWQWQECTRCGFRRKVAMFYDRLRHTSRRTR